MSHWVRAVSMTAAAGAVIVVALAARGSVAPWRTPPRHDTVSRRVRGRLAPGYRRAGAGVGIAVAVIVVGALPAATLAGGAALAVTLGRARAARQRTRLIDRGLADVIDLLVVGVRAGLTPRHALASIAALVPAPFADAIHEVARLTERGRSFPDALGALPDMLGIRVAPLADAIASCERYGLALEPLLVELTDQARAARQRADQADARTLPVRLAFPLVCCTLPSYVLVAIVPAVLATVSSLGDHVP